MLFTALAHLMLQSPAPVPEIAWDAPAPAVAEVAAPRPEGASVPQWALTDPFGYERARCNPMVRGDTRWTSARARSDAPWPRLWATICPTR